MQQLTRQTRTVKIASSQTPCLTAEALEKRLQDMVTRIGVGPNQPMREMCRSLVRSAATLLREQVEAKLFGFEEMKPNAKVAAQSTLKKAPASPDGVRNTQKTLS